MRVVVDPAQLVLESDRIDHQRVAVPSARRRCRRTKARCPSDDRARRGESSANVVISSYRNATRFEFCTISNGTPLMLARGMPANRHSASGLIDLVQIVLIRRLARRRERRSADAAKHSAHDQRPFPEPGKVGLAVRHARRRFRRAFGLINLSRSAGQLRVRILAVFGLLCGWLCGLLRSLLCRLLRECRAAHPGQPREWLPPQSRSSKGPFCLGSSRRSHRRLRCRSSFQLRNVSPAPRACQGDPLDNLRS